MSNNRTDLWYYFVNEMKWGIGGYLTVIFCIICLGKIRTSVVEAVTQNSVYMKDNGDYSITLLRKIFSSNYQLLVTIPFILVTVIFQTYFLIINPWEWWGPWYSASYGPTFFKAIVAIFYTGYLYFFSAMLGFLCFASIYLLHKMRNVMRDDIEVKELDSSKLTKIGNACLVISISWILSFGPNLIALWVAPIDWWTAILIFTYLIGSIFLFSFPIITTRITLLKILKAPKDDAKRKLMIDARDVLETPGIHIKASTEIIALDIIENKIDRLAWPIESNKVTQFISASIIPIIMLIMTLIRVM